MNKAYIAAGIAGALAVGAIAGGTTHYLTRPHPINLSFNVQSGHVVGFRTEPDDLDISGFRPRDLVQITAFVNGDNSHRYTFELPDNEMENGRLPYTLEDSLARFRSPIGVGRSGNIFNHHYPHIDIHATSPSNSTPHFWRDPDVKEAFLVYRIDPYNLIPESNENDNAHTIYLNTKDLDELAYNLGRDYAYKAWSWQRRSEKENEIAQIEKELADLRSGRREAKLKEELEDLRSELRLYTDND